MPQATGLISDREMLFIKLTDFELRTTYSFFNKSIFANNKDILKSNIKIPEYLSDFEEHESRDKPYNHIFLLYVN